MPGTAGQTAGEANANVEDPEQKPVPPEVPNPQPPLDPPHRGESEPEVTTTATDARGIGLAARTPLNPNPVDPRGEPGVAEAAEAEAERARTQRAEELRAQAEALEQYGTTEPVDLNQSAGAPLDSAGNPVVEGHDPRNPPPIEDAQTGAQAKAQRDYGGYQVTNYDPASEPEVTNPIVLPEEEGDDAGKTPEERAQKKADQAAAKAQREQEKAQREADRVSKTGKAKP